METHSEAYEKGKQAGFNGEPAFDNPYWEEVTTKNYFEWLEGWSDGRKLKRNILQTQ